MEKPHVLIVDDEENTRFTLSEALSSLPLEADTAVDGKQALKKIEERDFSAICYICACQVWDRMGSGLDL